MTSCSFMCVYEPFVLVFFSEYINVSMLGAGKSVFIFQFNGDKTIGVQNMKFCMEVCYKY
jgi:hypothetical protein